MKRFWKEASVTQVTDGWQVALDGRAVRTQAGLPQVVPTRALAQAMAGEWQAQGETIDPRGFALRDLADFAIDRVASQEDDAVAKALAFAQTDTLCYRADPGTPLARRQDEEWEPLLARVEQREGVTLERVEGILHRPQPETSMTRLENRLSALDPFRQAAVFTLASLAASLCIALEAMEQDADPGTLWRAANLEEDMQAEIWGRDAEAEAARAEKRAAFLKAYEFLSLLAD
jgi:chaperone required for assembly of F1-ATPase